MFEDVLLSLLRNAILLISLGALYDIIPLKPRPNSFLLNILTGFILGLIGVAIMSLPWILTPGVIIDARSILLSISGLFFAPLSTLIAVIISGLYRLYVGGAGMPAGLALVISSAGWGLLWRYLRPKNKLVSFHFLEMYVFGMIVSVSMLLYIWLLLPPPEGPQVLRAITLPVLLIYPLATVLLGHLLSHQQGRKEIQQEIQENEEHLRQIVQNMPVMLNAFDANHNIIVWNKECERVTGYKAEEIINNPKAIELFYPDPANRQILLNDLILSNQKTLHREWALLTKDGSSRTVSWVSSSNEVHIPGWHSWAIGVDVTERIQALEALKESETQFRRIVETAGEGIWMIDAENNTTYVNQRMADILGYTIEEMLDTNLFDHMDAAAEMEAKKNVERRRQGIIEQHDFRFKHKDGHDVWALLSTTPVIDSKGQYEGALAMLMDITERKRIEEELALYRKRLQKAQEIGRVGSWEFNIATGKVWASDESFHIYGLTPPPDNDLPIETVETFIPEREMVHQALLDLINEGKPYDLEFEIRPPHGRYTVITSKAELVKDEYSNPTRVTGVIQDVTKRKLAEERIQQLNAELEHKVEQRTAQLQNANQALEKAIRARDTFLANMSHELRTPLTAILGMSEILEEQLRGPLNERQMHFIRNIYSSGEHLLQLINDVLDLSKMEASYIKLDMQKLDLRDICEASLAFIQKQAKDKHLHIHFSQKTRSPVIEADGRRLKQILINLLSNAVKFTPDHGEIGLEVKDDPHDNNLVQFIVWDTGIGISAKDQEMLFQPFVQVDSNLNRSYEGTELGLVLVSRLTNLHKGQVNLESEPGKGTRVTVRLPYRQDT